MRNNIGCELTSGFQVPKACALKEGGVKEVFMLPLANYDEEGSTYDSNDKITSLNIFPGGTLWFKFEQVPETAFAEQKQNTSDRTGGIFWEQSLTMVYHKNNAELRKQLLQMIETPLVVIFGDNQDRYWLMGSRYGMDVNATIAWEKNLGGLNGEIVTLRSNEPFPAYEVVASAITYSTTVITGGGNNGLGDAEPVGPTPN